ncbi:MAG: calcium-binding protein, partial [Dechloromonas sp.]
TAAGTYTLSANVENATVTGTVAGINITGNDLNNDLTGNAVANTLNGGAGNDILTGGAGNDTLIGGSGDDEYILDIASDVVTEAAAAGDDTVKLAFSSSASYTLTANVENAIVTTSGVAINVTGNDLANSIVGNDVANIINGGAGNDTIEGAGGNDVVNGGLGSDKAILRGVLGDYAITRPSTTQTVFTYMQDGSTLTLTDVENIYFDGDFSEHTLAALVAQIGSIGNDTLSGGNDSDTLNGGLGNDSLSGGNGDDDLLGGDGVDTLQGGAGNDILDGGLGSDLYRFGIAGGDDIIVQNDTLTASIDTIEIDAAVGNYASGETTLSRGWHSYDDLVLTVNSGSPGAEGVDHIVVNNFFANDLLNASAAIDQIRFATDGSLLNQAQILAELLKGTATDDWLRGYANTNDSISGLAGNDMIGGAAGNDTLDGGLGNDTLTGDEGNDSLIGGAGHDSLLGGTGNDTLFGGAGNDTLEGGDGSDTYVFNLGNGHDQIADSGGDADVLNFGSGILATNTQVRRDGDDLLVTFSGQPSDELEIEDYFTSGQIETFRFGDGNTWSSVSIKAKVLQPTGDDDEITGYLGSELLRGLAGNDTINGGGGNDTINGGIGDDLLTGGTGSDRFVFDTLDGTDTITDFTTGSDTIALSKSVFGLAGAVGTTTNLAGLTGTGQFAYDSGTGELSFDADGAGGGAAVTLVVLGQGTHPASLGNDFMIVG